MPRGYKFTDEQRKRLSIALSGKKKSKEHNLKVGLANNGKKRTIEQRERISESHKGYVMPIEQKIKIGLGNKNKKVSEETRSKLRDLKLGKKCPGGSGERHGLWKGGITPLVEQIRHSFEYRQWTSDIFHRDNFTCQKCFKRGGILNAHHTKQFSIIFKENNIKSLQEARECCEFWNINNGITLCEDCHKEITHA